MGEQNKTEAWVLAPMEPTPEIIAAAAIAIWPLASEADIELARQAAPIVLMQMDLGPDFTVETLAAALATMAPAYRAMIAAAPKVEPAEQAKEPTFLQRWTAVINEANPRASDVPLTAQQAPAQPARADHDCGYERGSVLCRVCDLRQSNAGLTPQPAAPAQPPAKVDEREALTGWQDIETAPRLKGQRVLLLRDAGNGPFHAIGYALDGLPGWHSAECRGLETLEELGYRVTHWMPLPPAPTVAEKENGNG